MIFRLAGHDRRPQKSSKFEPFFPLLKLGRWSLPALICSTRATLSNLCVSFFSLSPSPPPVALPDTIGELKALQELNLYECSSLTGSRLPALKV